MDDMLIDASRETGPYLTNCPLCQKKTRWKPSGRGKHVGQVCIDCGIVGIRLNPIFKNQIKPPLTLRSVLKEHWQDFLRRL